MGRRRDDIALVLRQRTVAGLHLGVLTPGARLPSVRALASEFGADPRVVLAAYRQLEAEGLVELRPRSGVFVADTTASAGEMLPRLAGWVVEVLVQALARGVPAIEFPERVRGCLETVRLQAVCIECNDDQITGLCSELEHDYGFATSAVNLDLLTSGVVPDEVQRADLLVTTTYHSAEVQRFAERHGKPWVVVALRPEFLSGVARLLEQGPLYFVVKDPRFAAKLPGMLTSTAGEENLRVLVAGRDDLSGIPESAPAYVMLAARDRLDCLPPRMRVIPAPRVFSLDSARALLHVIVQANMAVLAQRETAAA